MKQSVIIVILLLPALAGCSRRTAAPAAVPVHDTVYQKVVQSDSVFVDRWHSQSVKGDTVFVHDSIYRWVHRYVHDTVHQRVEVPVEVPVEVVREVQRPLSWWQGTMVRLGYLALLAIVVFILYFTFRLWLKR